MVRDCASSSLLPCPHYSSTRLLQLLSSPSHKTPVTNRHKLGAVELFSHGSGDQKSKIQVSQGMLVLQAPKGVCSMLPGGSQRSGISWLHDLNLCLCLHINFLSLFSSVCREGTCHRVYGPASSRSMSFWDPYLNNTCKDLFCILRGHYSTFWIILRVQVNIYFGEPRSTCYIH